MVKEPPYNNILLQPTVLTDTYLSAHQFRSPPMRFAHIVVNVTNYVSGSITPSLVTFDPASGASYPLIIGTPMTDNGLQVIKVGPGIQPHPNVSANDFLPDNWQVILTAAEGTNLTASIGSNVGV